VAFVKDFPAHGKRRRRDGRHPDFKLGVNVEFVRVITTMTLRSLLRARRGERSPPAPAHAPRGGAIALPRKFPVNVRARAAPRCALVGGKVFLCGPPSSSAGESSLADRVIKPSSLKKGDRSASSRRPAVFPAKDLRRLDACPDGLCAGLLQRDFDRDLYFAGTWERRLRELEALIARDDIAALVCVRGGYAATTCWTSRLEDYPAS